MGSSGGSSGGGGITGLQAAQYSRHGPLDFSHFGMSAMTGDPVGFSNASTVNAQDWFTRLWIPAGFTVSGIYLALANAGVWDAATTGNALALYDDGGTLTDSIPVDDTYWQTAGWRGAALSGGTIAAQTSGRFVYACAKIRGYAGTPPAFAFANSAGDRVYQYTGPATTKRRTFYQAAAATFPATINPASTGTATGYAYLIGLLS
jgi:hypothetical protein